MQRDEIYLIDIWRIFLHEWKWFAAMLILALLCAFAFTHFARRQWEASAWFRIGQVGMVPAGQFPQVEPLPRVLERLGLVPFQNGVLASVGISKDAPAARLYRKSLKLEPMPYAGPLIKLTLRADSPQAARRLAEATVAYLQAVERQLGALPLAQARANLDEVESQLKETVAERDRLVQAITSANRKGDDTSAALLASVALSEEDRELHGLQQQRNDLLARLSPVYTYETSLIWPVYVPRDPVFPNPMLAWLLGILAGMCLGAFAAIARNASRRRAAAFAQPSPSMASAA